MLLRNERRLSRTQNIRRTIEVFNRMIGAKYAGDLAVTTTVVSHV
jgi:hypothetical protein